MCACRSYAYIHACVCVCASILIAVCACMQISMFLCVYSGVCGRLTRALRVCAGRVGEPGWGVLSPLSLGPLHSVDAASTLPHQTHLEGDAPCSSHATHVIHFTFFPLVLKYHLSVIGKCFLSRGRLFVAFHVSSFLSTVKVMRWNFLEM